MREASVLRPTLLPRTTLSHCQVIRFYVTPMCPVGGTEPGRVSACVGKEYQQRCSPQQQYLCHPDVCADLIFVMLCLYRSNLLRECISWWNIQCIRSSEVSMSPKHKNTWSGIAKAQNGYSSSIFQSIFRRHCRGFLVNAWIQVTE
ncbi:hypothetical protein GLOTRDRAFT_109210 [Gloeophyllum trabeum ATCC 11539]|uniref:Uncharacterized protein n=1 Tax=Gloeophyllum trabeum (strain ATCC 11539 / FP-39264 / Madison 617) TaxID=670483 RepID=S7QN47_GLOTA|nr:uncharacterized protein GLOTRDRAFT_109210 [Gloeophyllum trabeum ATCC 11539]EPQ60923.1 hypothetical protein GLOTRDRAFT_109210 [Gloeophyllum trabeum ATCC 11539]